jgi:ferredoxin-NADP reductase
MTTTTLALLIALALLAQLAAALAVWHRRRRVEYAKSLVTQGTGRSTVVDLPADRSDGPAWKGFKPFRVVRRVYENGAGDICSFYLAPTESMTLPDFKPGQFLTFQFELPAANGGVQRVMRCYSLSDRPQPEAYRISVKREPEGLVSNHLHDQVQEGDTLMVKAPSGHFHLLEEPPLPLVLIAGGIGITPMLSMLLSLLNRDSEREIWLFYGVRNGREVIMHDQLLALADYYPRFHLHLCYSRPHESDRLGIDYQHAGRVDIPLLQSALKLTRYQFYICGPGAMMESIVPGLEAIGIAPEDIHYEAFGPASVKRSGEQVVAKAKETKDSWQVKFSRSGRSVEWNGRHDSLLQMAEAEGVDVDSGCRAGSCGGCQSRVEKGEVEYLQEPIADVQPGHCLLCISRPKSDLELAV